MKPAILVTLTLFCALGQSFAANNLQTVGQREFTLRLPTEGLFAQEEVELAFHITAIGKGKERTPVEFARIRAVIDMPGMPGMPKFEALAHSHGIAGDYGVHPTFAHGGEYRLILTMLPGGQLSTSDPPAPGESVSVEFALNVKDAAPNRPPRPAPYELLVTTSPEAPQAGQPVALELGIRMVNSLDGRLVKEFDVMHEKLMHVFLVRADFGQFAHEHPEPLGRGKFLLRHTFAAAGVYRIFVDAAPKGAGSQVLFKSLTVAGEAGEQFDIYGASTRDRGLEQKLEDIHLKWKLPSAILPTGKTIVLTASLTDTDGRPLADLEPYLGAMGHLLLINQDTQTFVHSHPDDRTPNPVGTLPFLTRFPKLGLYRGWFQFQRKGKIKTATFIVHAE